MQILPDVYLVNGFPYGRHQNGYLVKASSGLIIGRALSAIKSIMKRGAVMYWFAGGEGGEPVLAKALLAISQHFTLLNSLVWDKVDPGLGWRWRRSWEAIIEASNGKPSGWYG
jgi:hypothetical protein